MMLELIMQKLTQIGLFVISSIFYIAGRLDNPIIGKAFDQLFSIGLLCILAYMLYKEWKISQQYNEGRDKRLEKIIENNTKALNQFRDEFRYIHRKIEKNEKRINNISDEQRA